MNDPVCLNCGARFEASSVSSKLSIYEWVSLQCPHCLKSQEYKLEMTATIYYRPEKESK
jgi:DNA-directed RNA polymerase subunit RPC12/RpoP